MCGNTFSDFIVYVDESGDHGLESVNPTYPVFVLAFCVFLKETYVSEVVPAIQRLKFKYWGHDAVVLHGNEIRKQKGEFAFLTRRERREKLLEDLNDLVRGCEFILIASVIDKYRLNARYADPANPYDIAMRFCMERLQMHLQRRQQVRSTTHVVVERRGEKEDRDLELAFRRTCEANRYVGRMPNLEIRFANKHHNSAGLQLADLVAHPIGRHCINPDQPNRAYEIIEGKFRRSPDGRAEGWGLKTFP